MKAFYFSLILILNFSCEEKSTVRGIPPDAYSPKMIGKWSMEQVKDVELDVTTMHNPQKNRWIQFYADHTFVSDGDPYGRNTGKWSIDPALEELYLDSDEGEGDDSYWHIRFYQDRMIWKGRRSDFTTRFTLTHKRMK